MVQDPKERARTAAEDIAGEGAVVTARAVRQRARVTTAVAAEVAREWNEAHPAGLVLPPIPESAQRRVEGLWAEAVFLARAEWDDARAFMEGKVAEAEGEVESLMGDLSRLDFELDSARGDLDAARGQILELRALLEAAQGAVHATELRAAESIAGVRGECAELRGLVAGLREALAVGGEGKAAGGAKPMAQRSRKANPVAKGAGGAG
jgi:hypothetical protein